nr:transducin beta-like protein 3 [Tanacetum cinerariifolium]
VRVYDLASMSCSYVLARHAEIVFCLDTYDCGMQTAEAALELEEVTNKALELMRLADGHLQI